MSLIKETKNKIKVWLIILLVYQFIFCGFSFADDLLRQMFHPAQDKEIVIDWGLTPEDVGKHVFIGDDWQAKASAEISLPGLGKITADANKGITIDTATNKPACKVGKCTPECEVLGTIISVMGHVNIDTIGMSDILNFGGLESIIPGLDLSSLAAKMGANVNDPVSVLGRLTDSDIASCRSRGWNLQVKASANASIGKKAPMTARITRMLLAVTIALSITMILYNGVIYIVQTGQGKEGKSLTKNIALIIVGILIALFSVIIVRVIESIPTTLSDPRELPSNGYEEDRNAIGKDKGISAGVSRRDSLYNYF